jgi:(S)-ureidoglycine aminohydrolase
LQKENMTDLFGLTRTVVRRRFAVLAPSGFGPGNLPGWEKATCQVLISPALGARFCQVLITLERDGQCLGNTGASQYFLYLLEGTASVEIDERRHRLEAGNYVYLPAGKDIQFKSGGASTRILIFQKPYQALAGAVKPTAFVGHERESKSQAFQGREEVRSQPLLPVNPSFDMSVDLLTWQPGAALPRVESHFRENGLLLLRGQGLYRLAADWHPVQAGDAIWVGPYCPQWFVAVGKAPACFIRYQDDHRDPL